MASSTRTSDVTELEAHGSDGMDHAGIVASTVCAIHCVLVAALPSLLSGLGLGALIGHEAEWAFTSIAIGIAAFMLVITWRRNGPRSVKVLLAAGIVGLLGARFAEELEAVHELGMAIGIAAGALLVAGHIISIRANRLALSNRSPNRPA